VLPLASWLLCLLLSFDYQNPCLLFLKLQVQDQKDYFWQTVWGLFLKNSSHLCSWNFMLDLLDLSNQVLFCFIWGSSLSVIWLYVIWIFHLLYGGLNKLPEMNVRMNLSIQICLYVHLFNLSFGGFNNTPEMNGRMHRM
jgi:hypothetical protein